MTLQIANASRLITLFTSHYEFTVLSGMQNSQFRMNAKNSMKNYDIPYSSINSNCWCIDRNSNKRKHDSIPFTMYKEMFNISGNKLVDAKFYIRLTSVNQ
uniref:Uncharacterized protein n=1 Tax=Heterorhabditis bacteriophora TaxID=37862 RepID=A0A1I7W6B6_HETBA